MRNPNIGVERPPEPTLQQMTFAELEIHRRRQRGEVTSSESDRLTRQAMGISETLEAPRPPEHSPLRSVSQGVRTGLEGVVKTSDKKANSEK